jgi:hypothetical protein
MFLAKYWNNKFGILQTDGRVSDVDNYTADNQTYNAWNVDLRYSWYFALGSQITLPKCSPRVFKLF